MDEWMQFTWATLPAHLTLILAVIWEAILLASLLIVIASDKLPPEHRRIAVVLTIALSVVFIIPIIKNILL